MSRRKPGTLISLEVEILSAGLTLQSREGRFYGFALAKELSAQGGGKLTAHGTLYKALARMTDARLLETTWEDSPAAESEGRPRRRFYTVTAEGEVAYRAAIQQAAAEAARAVQSPVTPTVAIRGGLA